MSECPPFTVKMDADGFVRALARCPLAVQLDVKREIAAVLRETPFPPGGERFPVWRALRHEHRGVLFHVLAPWGWADFVVRGCEVDLIDVTYLGW